LIEAKGRITGENAGKEFIKAIGTQGGGAVLDAKESLRSRFAEGKRCRLV